MTFREAYTLHIELMGRAYQYPIELHREHNPKKKNGYFVYICPYCERKVRATSELFISCGGAVGDVHAPADMELETE